MSRLREFYTETAVPQLKEKLQLSNIMEVPRITKITLNMGVGEAIADRKIVDKAMGDLELIAGQKPVMRRARKSVATFKLRDGMPIGCKVTLRRERMYEFLDRLISIAIPRIRDFRGLSVKALDGRGNYSMGVQEQIIFPEIDYDHIDAIRGLDITITTSARTNEEGQALLEAFNFPFKK
ncbi:MAG: 50S ribosomal protein L5 [Gammaproteobacteria bacterium]|jgi:large subunit ribosomal protein L5|nr:50S ribosomal protein L5 [Gammaproteobacteria bacterium]